MRRRGRGGVDALVLWRRVESLYAALGAGEGQWAGFYFTSGLCCR